MTGQSALSRAKELKRAAKQDPEHFSQDEMIELVEITEGNYQEARIEAVSAIDQLYMRPELFEPILEDLIEYSAYYPPHVEGIPAPIDWTSDEDLMEVVFISDAVARVAKRQPPLLVPYANQLTEIVTSERNYPKYHLFTLGMIGSVDPDVVPIKEIQSQLCSLLSNSTNGYAGWSADTLRRIGDPSVLPELRKHAPEDRSEARDEAEWEAFEDTIEELETATQD